MTYNITTIVQAIITLGVGLITAILIPYIKSKTTAEQQANLKQWVQIAVQSVEIMYTQLNGEEKLQKAVETLRSYGITLDIEKLRPMIEAAVLQLKVEGKELKRCA